MLHANEVKCSGFSEAYQLENGDLLKTSPYPRLVGSIDQLTCSTR
ncbi:unnamed protein product [Brassica napus]|uniref:(rape) hypothetical protein n=1 Tax=Brassica napus TaxID=3708 RepID=A0A816K418_BRANA|nr:unnamed protein product [Brassica napus]